MHPLGNILEIDLSRETFRFRSYPHKTAVDCLAGRGFNVAHLHAHLAGGTDPLGSRNMLILSCGLLTGETSPVSTRLHVNALSPLTGLLGSSNVGGDFGPWLRMAGIQSLIISGQAERPVYLLIDKDRVVFADAAGLCGKDTWRTQERLRKELGGKAVRSLVIGPAGENGVLYACVMTGKDHAAGRTGMGAVMGAKRLKAIVVRARAHIAKTTPVPAQVRSAVKSYVQKIMASPDFHVFKKYGGAGYVKWADDKGIMTAHNFRTNRFEGIDRIDGRRLNPYKIKSTGCRRCPVQCKAELDFGDAATTGTVLARPEFEPMINLGPKCGLDDLKALVHIDNLCSRLGLDNISTGSVIAFAMDLYERGILDKKDCGGLELTWGNAAAMETLVERIAVREGLGDVLASGVRKAAKRIGKGARDYAAHVKGLELAAYHPRTIMGTALGYAVAGRGGDYSSVYAAMEYNWTREKAAAEFGTPDAVDLKSVRGKAPLVKRAMIVNAVLDCLGICKVPALSMIGTFDLKDEAALAAAVTGLDLTAGQLFSVGERIVNIERLLNLRFGATAEDDRLPRMFFTPEYAAGRTSTTVREELSTMRDEFYREMGWDRQGCPTTERCKALGIDTDLAGE